MNITKRKQQLASIFLFYTALLYTRIFGEHVLPEFFSSSANEGMQELLIRLLLTLMVITSLMIEMKLVRTYTSRLELLRFLTRVYVWLLFSNTILYKIYAISLSDITLHLIFAFAFLLEVSLLMVKETPKEKGKTSEASIYSILYSSLVISMLLLTVFQLDGVFGGIIHALVYLYLFIYLYLLKKKQTLKKKNLLKYLLWILFFLTFMNIFEEFDIVINGVYIFGRVTVRFGLYLLMYLPLYKLVLQKKNGCLV